MNSPPDDAQVLLYVCLIGGESRDFIEASFGSTQVALLDVDHAEVVPRLNILRFHLHDPEEASLGRCQVAVVVDVDVAEQYQSLDVVRMMLKPRAGLVIENSSRPTPRSRPRASRPNTRPRFRDQDQDQDQTVFKLSVKMKKKKEEFIFDKQHR